MGLSQKLWVPWGPRNKDNGILGSPIPYRGKGSGMENGNYCLGA